MPQAVLYFPADPPNRLFQTGPLESGVSLHSRRVLVKKSASDILPKWLWFLRGVVDCEDLPLNVSREHVQDTQLQRKLASVIVKRILKFLNDQVPADFTDSKPYECLVLRSKLNIRNATGSLAASDYCIPSGAICVAVGGPGQVRPRKVQDVLPEILTKP